MNYYSEDREDEGIICPDCGGRGFRTYLTRLCRTCRGTGMIQDSYEVSEEDLYQPSGDANDLEYA